MSSQSIRFILDENVDVKIARQLQNRGIYAVSARDLSKLGQGDPALLEYAIENGLVVCSHDTDFLDLAKTDLEHTGIVFIPDSRREIGTVVKALTEIARTYRANDMKNIVLYL